MRASWIEACRHPVVPYTKVHAMALTPLLLYMVWWSWTTFVVVVIVALTMAVLQIKGRHPKWVVNRLQSRLRGETVSARSMWYRRRRTRLESLDAVDLAHAWDANKKPGPDTSQLEDAPASKAKTATARTASRRSASHVDSASVAE